jgi:hypothetical protein
MYHTFRFIKEPPFGLFGMIIFSPFYPERPTNENRVDTLFSQKKGGILKYQEIHPDVADNLTTRTWVNRSERFQGEPIVKGALTSQTLAGVHFG